MVNKNKELLFSITKKDLRIDTFRSGGKGGQHQNTSNSGCRITHIDSGAVGEARDGRSFHQNRKKALQRLVDSEKFKKWHMIESSRIIQQRDNTLKDIDKLVDDEMKEENIKVDYYNPSR